MPLKVLGDGANVLVSDNGFDGVVVRLDQPAFRVVQWRGSTVTVGAGVDLMPFSRQCASLGMSGLECMAGIPATVGGAVRMNAGGKFGDFGDVVTGVDVLTPEGRFESWSRERLAFGYRRSAVRGEIILSAELQLRPDDPERIRATYDEYFEFKKRSQPLAAQSAGCIFKNPPGESAGRLIDRAGLKGAVRGGASVSRQHANFIVAERHATAGDVIGLIDLVRQRVAEAFGVQLEVEVDIWQPVAERTVVT